MNYDYRSFNKHRDGRGRYQRPLDAVGAKARIANPASDHDVARCWCVACRAERKHIALESAL